MVTPFRFVKWHKLKKIPYNLDSMTKKAQTFTMSMRNVRNYPNSYLALEKTLQLRPLFNDILVSFINLGFKGSKESLEETAIGNRIQHDIRRIQNYIDKFEEDNFPQAKKLGLPPTVVIRYQNLMETILTSLVYESLIDAWEESKKKPEEFLFWLWAILKVKSGLLLVKLYKEDDKGFAQASSPKKFVGNKSKMLEDDIKELSKLEAKL